MNENVKPESLPLEQGVWNITPGMSASYLVVGETGALVIDTGWGDLNLTVEARRFTDKPLRLVITHNHPDHVGGAAFFDELWCGAREVDGMKDIPVLKHPLTEGDQFDLGGRVLQVLELPGHTPGSIGLYDAATNSVFVGDMVSVRPIFFIEGERDPDDFIVSMDKLLALPAEKIYGCHGPMPCGKDVLVKLKKAAAMFRDGKLEPKPSIPPEPGEVYLHDGVGFRVATL